MGACHPCLSDVANAHNYMFVCGRLQHVLSEEFDALEFDISLLCIGNRVELRCVKFGRVGLHFLCCFMSYVNVLQ